MDNTFRYKTHINTCLRKSYTSLKLLYPLRSILPIKTKICLCDSLVLSRLTYGSQVFSSCLDVEDNMKLQRLQNSCLRFIYGIRKYAHISHKLKDAKWMNMKNRFHYHRATLYHSIVSNKKPAYLYNKIRFRTDVHNVNIRRKNIITPPLHRLALLERSFSYDIYRVYNNVPANLKILTKKAFGRAYSGHLFQNQWEWGLSSDLNQLSGLARKQASVSPGLRVLHRQSFCFCYLFFLSFSFVLKNWYVFHLSIRVKW